MEAHGPAAVFTWSSPSYTPRPSRTAYSPASAPFFRAKRGCISELYPLEKRGSALRAVGNGQLGFAAFSTHHDHTSTPLLLPLQPAWQGAPTAPLAFANPVSICIHLPFFHLWLRISTQEEDILEMAIFISTSRDGFPKVKVGR